MMMILVRRDIWDKFKVMSDGKHVTLSLYGCGPHCQALRFGVVASWTTRMASKALR